MLQTMESVNLFCGKASADETKSNHLVLSEIKLPTLDEQYVDHRAGGAPVAIEIDTVVARLEVTFMLAGWQTQVQNLYHSWGPDDNWFTAYGLVRDRATGVAAQAIALFRGRLGRIEPENWRKGDLQHHNYSIRAITHYELMLADESLVLWDFFTNTFLIGGVDRNADTNAILLTGATNVSPTLITV